MEIDATSNIIRFTDLSHTEQVNRKIDEVFQKQDRNTRRELFTANLAFQSSLNEIKGLIEKGSSQKAEASTTSTESHSAVSVLSSELDDPVSSVSGLSGISDGIFVINGINIAVDTSTDSLNDIISNINSSNAGVTASFNTTSSKLEITSSGDFALSNSSSTFFQALNLTSGTIRSDTPDPKANFYEKDRFTEAMNRFTNRLNKVLTLIDEFRGEELEEQGQDYTSKITEAIKDSITNTVDSEFDTESF